MLCSLSGGCGWLRAYFYFLAFIYHDDSQSQQKRAHFSFSVSNGLSGSGSDSELAGGRSEKWQMKWGNSRERAQLQMIKFRWEKNGCAMKRAVGRERKKVEIPPFSKSEMRKMQFAGVCLIAQPPNCWLKKNPFF